MYIILLNASICAHYIYMGGFTASATVFSAKYPILIECIRCAAILTTTYIAVYMYTPVHS